MAAIATHRGEINQRRPYQRSSTCPNRYGVK